MRIRMIQFEHVCTPQLLVHNLVSRYAYMCWASGLNYQ